MPYSGISDKDLPDNVKKLPKKYREIWVKAFNAAFHSYDPKKHKAPNAEAYAFAVAWAAVNKAKEKAKKKKKEGFDVDVEDCVEVNESITVSLTEAKFDDEERSIEAVALESGWSANGVYYSKEVAESLAPFLLKRPKVFANHIRETKSVVIGRDVKEWAATITEAYGKDGKTYVKMVFTNNPMTSWIYDEVKRDPENVRFSIHAYVRGKKGKMEGKSGFIVEEFVEAVSLDVVDYDAAGGKAVRVLHSAFDSELVELFEGIIEDFREYVDKYSERRAVEALVMSFLDFLEKIRWNFYEDTEDKRNDIKKLVKEFIKQLSQLDIVKAYESNHSKEGGDEDMTLKELKEKYPELFEEVKESIIKEMNESEKIKKLEEKAKEADELLTELEGIKEQLAGKEEELEKISEELEKLKAEKEAREKEELVKKLVGESKLGKFEDLPEYIQKDLLSKKDEEEIKQAISALESLSNSKKLINDAGKTKPPKTTTKDNKITVEDFFSAIRR